MMEPWFETPSYGAVNLQDPLFITPPTLSLIFTQEDARKGLVATRGAGTDTCQSSRAYVGTILVRDPPRERLPSSTLEVTRQGLGSRLRNLDTTPALVDPSIDPYTTLFHQPNKGTVPRRIGMAKKRRSLQSVFVPAFLQGSSSGIPSALDRTDMPRSRSYSIVTRPSIDGVLHGQWGSEPHLSTSTSPTTVPSAQDSPPLDFLLDDDPFANLSSARWESMSRTATPVPLPTPVEATPTPTTPRSPLMSATDDVFKPPLTRALSTGAPAFSPVRIQPRTAHQKPAFSSRPSLPSLHSLAGMNVVLTKKVRKGRVGAGLPFEPWDTPSNCDVPPRVLQDPSAVDTQSLPPGTQPLLPSAIVAMASSVSEIVLAEDDPKPATVSSDVPSCPRSVPSPSEITPSSQNSSYSGHDVIDLYSSSRPASDEGHGAVSEDWVPDHSDLFTDLDTDTTSYDEFSPPPSSRVSSLDLSLATPLSRSISSTSNSSTGSLGSAINYKHQQHSFEEPDASVLTRSSSDDSDFLNSPPDLGAIFTIPKYLQNTSDLVSNWRNQFGADSFLELDDSLVSSGTADLLLGNDIHNPTTSFFGCSSTSSTDTVVPGSSLDAVKPPVTFLGSDGEGLSQVDANLDIEADSDMVDGSGWESHNTSGSPYSHPHSSQQYGGSSGSQSRVTTSISGRHHGGWGRGDDEDDDDGRDDRRRLNRGPLAHTSSSESTNSSEDESTDDYGQSPSATATNLAKKRFPAASAFSSDDDVPLAQRIPNALSAQQTIRRQVREERNQRKKERALREGPMESPASRERHTTLRPAGAGAAQPIAMSSSQEAAVHASQPQPRRRTLTMPGKSAHAFSPEDLAKKLQNVQIGAEYQQTLGSPSSPHLHHSHTVPSARSRTSFETSERISSSSYTRGRNVKDASFTQQVTTTPPSPHILPVSTLRSARSFHHADRRPILDERHDAPLPIDAEQKPVLSRNFTRSRSKAREEPLSAYSPQSRNRSLSSTSNTIDEPPVPPLPPRMSIDEQQQQHPRKLIKTQSARTSTDVERPSRPSLSRPSASLPIPAFLGDRKMTVQQRVFIGDMQRFNMVEISSSTSAGDVIEMIEEQGSLVGWAGIGEWMVWEVAQDFGMERPIRSFELLSDVQGSWNKDKTVNTFVLRMTPLAVPLSRSAIPASSPIHSGYVEWEVKRGKWSKRWMQLREHSIWLSKRDNGRDEVQLCALSNFDAYLITRTHRAPKPFAFAVKSTDNLSYFENTADYLHTFACSEKDGQVWMEKILVARSYVLHQERHVLFNPKSASGGAALSRSGTRKSTPQRPSAPLVSVPPFGGVQPHAHQKIFEPGSLLHNQP